MIWWRWLFVLCLSVFLYGMFRPEGPPGSLSAWDKELHFLAFATIALTGRLAFPGLKGWLFWPALLVLAPVIEWAQDRLHVTRVFDAADILANVLGIVAGAAVLGLWFWLRRFRSARRMA